MSNSLTTCHVNAQSLPAHYDEFSQYFTDNFFHIIAISETWLNPSIPSSSVLLPHHTLLRHDRVGRTGGGVALYVHSAFKPRILATSPPSDLPLVEYLLAEISFQSQYLLYAVVYRPPQVPFDASFETSLFDFLPSYKNVIISGDFNANFLSSSYDKMYLENLFYSLDLFIVPFSPTHHTRSTDTWLDLFVIDSPTNLLSNSQHAVPFLSLHDLICICYNFNAPSFIPKKIFFRDLASLTFEVIQPSLEAINWDPFFALPSVDHMVDFLTSNLRTILDIHAPLKSRTVSRPPAPWMNDEIRALKRRREALRRRFRRTRLPDDYEAYKRIRNQTQSLIRSTRSRYFHDAFSSAADPKSKWHLLRKLSLCNSTISLSTYPASPDDFNSHFASSVPRSHSSTSSMSTLGLFFNPDNFYFSYISPTALLEAIMKVRSESVGFDGIPIKLIKISLPVILPALLHIYNFSLQNSVFPSSWKLSVVKPLPKIPNPSSPNDFRPISILSNLSKPLEKLVHSQFSSFLEGSSLLNPLQSGFRPGFSTQSALTKILSDIQVAIDQKKITILILLDFTKAFDSIDHSILLSKLRNLSLSRNTLLWFQSFLSGRNQVVSLPDKPVSAPLPITSGVPQGSTISSTMFSLYINDLPISISHCSYHLYADDTQIYLSFPPSELEFSLPKIQKDLDAICAWASRNHLSLNPGKSKAIVLGSNPILKSLPVLPPFILNNNPIPFCSTVKNLGVIFDPTLSWKPHISQISRRCFSTLRQFRRSRHSLPQDTRKLLVSSLIFPIFDYGCVVYGGISGELEDRLKRLMNCFLRFIFGSPRYSHVTHLYSELKWLYPSFRRRYFLGSFLFQVISTQSPSYLFELLMFKSSINSCHTRSRPSDLYPPSFRTTSFGRSFLIRASNLWNSLPDYVRSAPTLVSFKSRLFLHLFSLQRDGHL